MSVAADTYLPAVWTLDTSTVQAIESSETDPKTRLDETGLFLTDATGAKVTQIRGPGGAIDILASSAATAPDERRLRWIRAAGGAVVADLSGFDIGGNGTLEAEAVSTAGAIPGLRTGVEAFSDGGVSSFVEAHTRTSGPPSVLRQSTIIIDDSGRSSFMMQNDHNNQVHRNQFIIGSVSPAGLPNGGTGFTVTRLGLGTYQLTFVPAFPSAPRVFFSLDGGGFFRIFVTAFGAGAVSVQCQDPTGAAADEFFSFLAICYG